MKKVILALFSLALVTVASVVNSDPVNVRLTAHNQRSGSGTLNILSWKTCDPPVPPATIYVSPCINPTNPWVVDNGVTGSTATWTWDAATGILASTGVFWTTSYISSNTLGKAVISDRVVDLTIDIDKEVDEGVFGETTASNYRCVEGNFLSSVGANGCGNYGLGSNVIDNSSVAYNVDVGAGPDPYCVRRTLGVDDEDTGNPRGVGNTLVLVDGCDPTDGAFTDYDLEYDDTATGGQLRFSNGICIGTGSKDPTCAGVDYLTFAAGPSAVDDGGVDDPRGEIGVLAGSFVNVLVMANDIAYANSVTVTVTTPPAHGTAIVSGSPGPKVGISITYTPADNPALADSFVYAALDADGVTSDTATVTITAWEQPATNKDFANTTRNVPIDIPVGANDFGFGNPVTVTITVPPDQGGTLTLPAAGPPASRVVGYAPDITAPGAAPYTETFTYQMTDGILTDTAVVSVKVSNKVPAAQDKEAKITTMGFAPGTIDNIFKTDKRPNSLGNAGAGIPVAVITQGTRGTATVVGTVITYKVTDLTFFTGTDTYTYTITDSDPVTPETATGTVTVKILDVVPALADASLPVTVGSASLALPLGITLGNGSAAQHVKELTQQASNGTCVLSAAGTSVTYTPTGDYTGSDSCEVTITDGDGDSDTGTITITVNAAGGGGQPPLPPSSGALDPWSLLLLAGVLWMRRKRNIVPHMAGHVAGKALVSLAVLVTALGIPVSSQAQEVQEIVVTTRRIEEKLKEVPLSITAFNSQLIEAAGINSLQDVAAMTPGLSFFNPLGENLPVPVIRGIVPQDIFGVNAAAIFVDGVYVAGREGLNFSQLDVERIEVVKGPQSAMYGRNAFSGAINYVTKKPSNEFEAKTEVEAGNRGKERVQGSVSGPILGDTLFGRVSGLYDDWDGSYDNSMLGGGNDIGGYRYRSFQGGLRWVPSETLEVSGGIYYSNDRIDESATASIAANCENQVETTTDHADNEPYPRLQNFCGKLPGLASLPDALDPVSFNPVLFPGGPVSLPDSVTRDSMPKVSQATGENRELTRGNLNVTWDVGFGTFDFLTGYSHTQQSDTSDFERSTGNGIPFLYCRNVDTSLAPAACPTTGQPLALVRIPMGFIDLENGTTVEELSQEMRFSSPSDRPLRYTAGLYYFHDDLKAYPGGLIATTPLTDPLTGLPVSINDVGLGAVPGGTLLAIGSYIFGQGVSPDGAIDPLTRIISREKTESWSVFGAVDYDLTEAWQARGEIRLTEESQTLNHYTYARCINELIKQPAIDPDTGEVIPGEYREVSNPYNPENFPYNLPDAAACGGDDFYDLNVRAPCDNTDATDTSLNYVPCASGVESGSARFETVTGRLSLKYLFESGWMAYGSVAWGQKPGGLQLFAEEVITPEGAFAIERFSNAFDPEKITAYELGIKGVTSDRRIGIDLAMFYNDWTNIVLRQLTETSPGSGLHFSQPVALNVNAGDARVWGWEATTDFVFTENLSGRLTASWTDSQLTNARQDTFSLFPSFYTAEPSCAPSYIQSFPDPTPERAPNPDNGDPGYANDEGNEVQNGLAAQCQAISGDVSGNTQMRQPEWTGSASLSYEHPLRGEWDWYARSDASYTGKIYVGNDNEAWIPPHTYVNLRLGVQSSRYTVEFWVRNLFDNDSPIAAFRDIYWTNTSDIAASQTPTHSNFDDFPPLRYSISYPKLRTFGLIARMRFGAAVK